MTLAAVHAKSMPVMLAPDKYGPWRSEPYASACALAVPYAKG